MSWCGLFGGGWPQSGADDAAFVGWDRPLSVDTSAPAAESGVLQLNAARTRKATEAGCMSRVRVDDTLDLIYSWRAVWDPVTAVASFSSGAQLISQDAAGLLTWQRLICPARTPVRCNPVTSGGRCGAELHHAELEEPGVSMPGEEARGRTCDSSFPSLRPSFLASFLSLPPTTARPAPCGSTDLLIPAGTDAEETGRQLKLIASATLWEPASALVLPLLLLLATGGWLRGWGARLQAAALCVMAEARELCCRCVKQPARATVVATPPAAPLRAEADAGRVAADPRKDRRSSSDGATGGALSKTPPRAARPQMTQASRCPG